MPIDSYADQAYYDSVVRLDEAVQSDFAELVLMGVEPTYPSGKYGYIVPAAGEGCAASRASPRSPTRTARELISQGVLELRRFRVQARLAHRPHRQVPVLRHLRGVPLALRRATQELLRLRGRGECVVHRRGLLRGRVEGTGHLEHADRRDGRVHIRPRRGRYQDVR